MLENKMQTATMDTVKVRETENGTQTVIATELYNWLEPKARFNDWIKRMLKYGFVENVDYWELLPVNAGGDADVCTSKKTSKENVCYSNLSNKDEANEFRTKKTEKAKGFYSKMSKIKTGRGGHNAKEYILSLDCAKSIAMLQRNERGRMIRRYFIEVEKQFRAIATPQQVNELYTRVCALEAKQIDYKEDWTIDRYLQVNGLYYGFDRTDRQQFGKRCTKVHKKQYSRQPKKVPHPSYLNGQNVYPYELINFVYKQYYCN